MEIKNLVLLVIFIVGIVLLQFIQAHSVDDIINKYIEALGGKDKLDGIQSVYMEGSRKMIGVEVPVAISKVQGKLFRTDFTIGGASGYIIITPTEGWSLIPIESENVKSVTSETLAAMQWQLDITGPLLDYKAKGGKAEKLGKEIINGRESFKIKLTLNTGEELIYFIDKETDLLTQSIQISSNDAGKEIITNYSDYKHFDGVMFPQIISNPAEGIMAGTTTLVTIMVNKRVDESLYKPYA